MRSLSLVLLLVAVLTGACADPHGAGAPPSPGTGTPDQPVGTVDPDAPVSATPGPPGPGDVPAERELIEPGPAIDTAPRPFESAHEVEPGVLRIAYWTGVEPCYVLADVLVEEDETTVTVTLLEGRAPSTATEDVPCIEIARAVATDVTLGAPLGDRQVVDGATGQPPPGPPGS